MAPHRLILLLFCFLIGLPAARSAAPPARKEIQALFFRIDEAYRKKDADAIRRLMERNLAVDFTRRTRDGSVMGRAEMIKSAAQDLSVLGPVEEVRTRIDAFTLKGDTAVVKTSGVFTAFLTDANRITVKLSNRTANRYTFVRSGGAWKLRKLEELSGEVRVNGRPPTPARSPSKPSKP